MSKDLLSYFPAHIERSLRGRYRLARGTFVLAVLLIGWCGFLQALFAGFALPTWAATLSLWPPVMEWAIGKTITVLLASLLAVAIAGLAVWTMRTDPRTGVRGTALILLLVLMLEVIFAVFYQIWPRLDLTIVEAGTDLLLIALFMALLVFVSPDWIESEKKTAETWGKWRILLGQLAIVIVILGYIQLLVGALLHQAGAFMQTGTTVMYWMSACCVWGVVVWIGVMIKKQAPTLSKTYLVLAGLILVQIGISLGIHYVMPASVVPWVTGLAYSIQTIVTLLMWMVGVRFALWASRRPINETSVISASDQTVQTI